MAHGTSSPRSTTGAALLTALPLLAGACSGGSGGDGTSCLCSTMVEIVTE
jgi:hypothetical protein